MAKKHIESDEPMAGVANEEGVIFVNAEKLNRAKVIIELVSGKRAPKDQTEAEFKDRWAAHFAEGEMAPKDAGALRFAYEKLGGLVRTHAEQEVHEEKVEEMQKKSKKRKIEG